MIDYRELSRRAIRESDKTRKVVGIKASSPISIFDVAIKLGIEVRFANLPTLEGVYSSNPGPVIVLGSDRPIGRQSFNCAHELGHHVFGHGQKWDEIESNRKNETPDEFLANSFAGVFLMPQFAVMRAFQDRGIIIKNATPEQLFRVANYFEVGYSTIVNHLAYGLNLMPKDKVTELLKTTPKKIRKYNFELDVDSEIVIVDQYWKGRPIDIRIGDYIVAPPDTGFDGRGIKKISERKNDVLFQGVMASPTSRLQNDRLGYCEFVRVMPRAYEGLAEYRHMEEPDDN